MQQTVRILVVDADAEDRAAIRRELMRELPGCEVVEASDAQALDTRLRRPSFDIVITDHDPGWADGSEVTARVKARAPEAAVVMFTARGSEELAVAAMKRGLDDYVAKAPGRLARLTATIRSLALRQGQRRRAQEIERRFKTLFEHAPIGIFRVGPDGRILDANPVLARILGARSPRELAGRRIQELPGDAEAVTGWRAALESGEEVSGRECVLGRLDGGRVRVRLSMRAIPGSDGAPEAHEGVVEDVTDRHEAERRLHEVEDQLRHAQKMEILGRLARGVAHDFNNVLTVVLGHSELLADAIRKGTCRVEDVEPIVAAGCRATLLTRQLLALSHDHDGPSEAIDLVALVHELAPMIRHLLGEEVAFTMDLPARCWKVRGPRGDLAQALLHLAVRARDAMPRGGEFRVAVRNVESREEGRADEVEVVAEERAAGGAGAADVAEPGLAPGPGLPVVQSAIRQCGGWIGPGTSGHGGASLRMILPRHETVSSETLAAPTKRRPCSPGRRILVADDDEALLGLVVRALRQAGCDVAEARDGPSAVLLAEAMSEPPHLLLADVLMPGMSGTDVARRLRDRWSDLPVVLMTGHAGEIARRRMIVPADVEILDKPFTLESLLAVVEQSLEGVAP